MARFGIGAVALGLIVLCGGSSRVAAQGAAAVGFASPIVDEHVAATLDVTVFVRLQFCSPPPSPFPCTALGTVTADVEGRTAVLTSNGVFTNTSRGYGGTIDLAGLSRGPHVVTVTAHNADGSAASSSQPFIYDPWPRLTFASPADRSIARPFARLQATCSDVVAFGCHSTEIRIASGAHAGIVLASGSNGVDEVVDLSAYDGQQLALQARAVSFNGGTAEETRTIFVESSPRLTEVETVGGSIIDITSDRILYQAPVGASTILRIRDRVTRAELDVPSSEGARVGVLTPFGCLFQSPVGASAPKLRNYELRSGVLLMLGETLGGLNVDLPFVLLNEDTPGVEVRDVAAGTTTTIDISSERFTDIGANGDLVGIGVSAVPPPFTGDSVVRYRNGVLKTLDAHGSPIPGAEAYSGVITDGINVVYTDAGTLGPRHPKVIAYTDQNQRVSLASNNRLFLSYGVRSGWIAFAGFDAQIAGQLFRRAPDGTRDQLSYFAPNTGFDLGSEATDVTIDEMNSEGGASFIHSGGVYVGRPGGQPVLIGSSLGKRYWLDGVWHVAIGGTLLRVTTLDGCDYALTPSTLNLTASGGEAVVAVAAARADVCRWTAKPVNKNPWARPIGAVSGNGPGVVRIAIAPNASPTPRTSYIEIGEANLAVVQAGVPATGAVTVTVDGQGSGTVTSAPTGIACGTACSQSFAGAQSIVLTATPAVGSVFAGWTGAADCADGTVFIGVPVTACTARFAPQRSDRPRDGIDLNGDGLADAFLYDAVSGQWSLQFGDGQGGFAPLSSIWSAQWRLYPADWNGDGVTDLFLYDRAVGLWFTAVNHNGMGWSYHSGQTVGGWSPLIADLTGDGRSDLVLYDALSGVWEAWLGDGGGGVLPQPRRVWSAEWRLHAGHFDADAREDLFFYNKRTGVWFIGFSTGAGDFTYRSGQWSADWDLYPGEFSGDPLTDLFLYDPRTGLWFMATNTGAAAPAEAFAYVSGSWSSDWSVHLGDLDGDSRSDIFLYNAVTGFWFESFWNASQTVFTYARGQWSPEWQVSLADFDGDRHADVFVYNASTGVWFESLNRGAGTFDYVRGVWPAGATIVATRR